MTERESKNWSEKIEKSRNEFSEGEKISEKADKENREKRWDRKVL